MTSTRGFDQGCPLAAAGFAVSQKGALEACLHQLQQLDRDAKLYSYLDDTYVVVDATLCALALDKLKEALAPLGLELNATKTQVWLPAGRISIPLELQSDYVNALPVLGSQLKTQGDSDDAPYLLGQTAGGLDEATGRLSKL